MSNRIRTFSPFLLLAVVGTVLGDVPEDVRSFLAAHCVRCHGPELREARVRLDGAEGYGPTTRQRWTKVHEMLATGEMPPADEDQPSAGERRRVMAWIEAESERHRNEVGAGGTRRLNRRELGAALRDLTGLDIDYAAALPGDGRVHGFDTGATGLQDAADSVARVMEVTRRAAAAIRFRDPAPGEVFAADLRAEEKDPRKAFDPWKERGFTVKPKGHGVAGEGWWIEPKWLGERGGWTFDVPPPAHGRGVLRVRLVVHAHRTSPQLPAPHLEVSVGGKAFGYPEITGTLDEPDELVYEIQLDDVPIGKKGIALNLCPRVELPYAVKGFENEDRSKPDEKPRGGPGLFRPKFDKKQLAKDEWPAPFVVLQRVEIEPNHVAPWPPAEWEADVGEIADDDASADRLLAVWIERAWRRPVAEAERRPFLDLFRRLHGDGMSFDDALRAAFQSVLMSGPFRYLASPEGADGAAAHHAIASRLSFMLVGAPPDGELRRLAAGKRLRAGKVLDAQVERLLDDPRSDAFFEPFVVQWLEMEQPITIAMSDFSRQDFRFGRYLKESMRRETVEYVARVFRENRPVRELVDSDWTMMNDSLAVHYGYDGIEGVALRPVTLRGDDPRGGGIVGHAGIQSMLTWMGENWVIYRGAWTLRHILDDAPPPPPLEVPELIPSDGENRGKTFRELLVQHQEDERCSVCHRKMDPLGFAFQNFDLSGRWRTEEFERYNRNELDGKIEWYGAGKSRPVDAEGRLPRGETFEDFAGFKRAVVEHYTGDVVRGVARNLVLYGTGRTPDVRDGARLREILADESKRGYRMRDVLKAIVRSDVFLGD